MTWEEVCKIALSFPGVEEGASYGTPGLKVNGKFLTRLRAEDNSVVLVDVTFDEREMLMEAEPEVFHITPHYKDYPSVLARLPVRCAISSSGAGATSRRRSSSRPMMRGVSRSSPLRLFVEQRLHDPAEMLRPEAEEGPGGG